MKNQLKDFFFFIKSPKETFSSNRTSFYFELRVLGFFFIFCIVLLIASSVLYAIISLLLDKEILRYSNKSQENTLYGYLKLFILGPILEELAFRLGLRRQKIKIAISLALLYYIGLSLLLKSNIYDFENHFFPFKVLSAFIIFMLLATQSEMKFIKRINYGYYFFSLCFLFSLLHITNYTPVTWNNFFFLPFSIFPQFLYGLVFGYVRLHSGLIWSIILHVFINVFWSLVFINQ